MTDAAVHESPTTESGEQAPLPVTSIAFMLITVAVLIKAWVAFGSWFYEDDFDFLSTIARGQNDLRWYFTAHSVHFMPVGLMLTTAVGAIGGFAWWAAALQITLLYAGAALACWWMLTRVFGRQPRTIAPLVFYLFSPIVIPAVTWWAVTVTAVAVQIPVFILIGAHVEYLRSRQRRWLAVVAVMLMLITGTYLKALVVTAVLGLFTVFYAVDEPRPLRRIAVTVGRWWRLWVLYVVLGAASLAIYARVQAQASAAADSAQRTNFSDLFESLIVRNLATGLLGGPWTWIDFGGLPRTLAQPNNLAVAASVTVLIGAAIYAVYRWRNAWMPLVLLLPAIAATYAGLAVTRAAGFSGLIGLESRYWADVLPYFVLAFGLYIMDVPGLPRVRQRRVDAPNVPQPTAAIVGVLYIASSLTSSVAYVQPWHENFPARQFVTGAVTAAKAADGITVADVASPASGTGGTLYPANTPNYLFAPTPGIITGVDSGVDLLMLDQTGLPRVAQARPDRLQDLSSEPCIVGSGRIELDSPTWNLPFWVTVAATFEHRTTVSTLVNGQRHRFSVPSGRHLLTFRTQGRFDHISLSTADRGELCPQSLGIGSDVEPA